ncbi:GFA family protein [Rhizobium sp. WYJ-E13]|uniref:GFA family protein n=1 Tax=Rhizobium sp. WYJ-E13 TaxID=2849093 RepID=UPI001C1EACA2|nr:GFA family protein [Rhizobium sp. WYJ-E13]QWW69698.1 GFA family protein [Rhizobium sp. WYJ-E13]
MREDHVGGCLCGAVRFTASEKPDVVVGCHCSQCRRQTGLYYASADVPVSAVSITGEENLRWFQSSDEVRRGFCSQCGSALFWQRLGGPAISIMAGAFDEPSGLSFGYHIFCADKGDFYEITDGLSQYAGRA